MQEAYYLSPGKIHFADLVKDSKLFRVGKNDVTKTRPGMAAKYSFKMAASEVASFETNFFRIADTLESETSISGKAEFYLL